jgi:MATE family multidrug resistance protein
MAPQARRRTEARALARIAAPVVIAEIGWMSMGLVDTVMVGPLGPEAIAASGLGSGVFTAIAIFGMGLLLGLDTLVSQAFGGGRLAECQRLLRQGLWLAALSAVPIMAVGGLTYARWARGD